MSLVLCDVTPGQILFLADSARPTENTPPADYPNDANKVLLSVDGRTGVGLAGTLNFPWQNTWTQPEKWVEHVLRTSKPDQVASPAQIVQTLIREIEALRGVPFNAFGIIVIAGFSDGLPTLQELIVRSTCQQITDLVVSLTVPPESLRLWGLVSWPELLFLIGKNHDDVPQAATDRFVFLTNAMEEGINALRASDDLRVAPPVVAIRISHPAAATPV